MVIVGLRVMADATALGGVCSVRRGVVEFAMAYELNNDVRGIAARVAFPMKKSRAKSKW